MLLTTEIIQIFFCFFLQANLALYDISIIILSSHPINLSSDQFELPDYINQIVINGDPLG